MVKRKLAFTQRLVFGEGARVRVPFEHVRALSLHLAGVPLTLVLRAAVVDVVAGAKVSALEQQTHASRNDDCTGRQQRAAAAADAFA